MTTPTTFWYLTTSGVMVVGIRYLDEHGNERDIGWFLDLCFQYTNPIWDSVIVDLGVCTNCLCSDCGCCMGCADINADCVLPFPYSSESHGYGCVM
jgi:hypothetical protein